MIYFSIGLPSGFGEWCCAVVAQLASQRGDGVAIVTFPEETARSGGSISVLDQAALSLIRNNSAHLVVVVREPDAQLLSALAETRVPFLLTLNDPRNTAWDMFVRGQPLTDATRATANLCPLFMEYAALPGALTLCDGDVLDDRLAAVLAIAKHLGIAVTDDQAQSILQNLSSASLPPPRGDWSTGVPPAEKGMVDGALGGYASYFAGRELGDIIWTPDFFVLASDHQRSPTGPIRLRDTGNGLFIFFGPYMHVPPGYWSVKVAMDLSPEVVGQTLTIDAYSGQILAVTTLTPNMGGTFTAGFNINVDAAAARNLEIRVMVGRNMAPGELTFDHVVLHPIALYQEGPLIKDRGDFQSALQL